MVEGEEPVEDLHAGGWAHSPAGHLAVGVEAVVQGDVIPAVGGHDGLVELAVDNAQAGHVRIGTAWQGGVIDLVGVKPSTYFRKNVISRLVGKGLLLERKVENTTVLSANAELVKLKDINA